LDQVQYLVSRLKAHGVYVNVNLIDGMGFCGSDEIGFEVFSIGDWKNQHVLGYFNDTALNLQKEYAATRGWAFKSAKTPDWAAQGAWSSPGG